MLRSEYTSYNYEGVEAKVLPITVLKGAGLVLNTKALLAFKIGTITSNISHLNVIGNDVYFSLFAPISLKSDAFYSISGGDNYLSYFKDFGNIKSVDNHPFRNQTAIKEIRLEKVTQIGRQFMQNSAVEKVYLPNLVNTTTGGTETYFASTALQLVDIRKCKAIGSSPSLFSNAFGGSGFTVNCHVFLKTANAGEPDSDILDAKNNKSAIVNFYDDNGIYHSTL